MRHIKNARSAYCRNCSTRLKKGEIVFWLRPQAEGVLCNSCALKLDEEHIKFLKERFKDIHYSVSENLYPNTVCEGCWKVLEEGKLVWIFGEGVICQDCSEEWTKENEGK